MSGVRPVRILAILEAVTVTGPAKNLIEFCRTTRPWNTVDLTIATFERPGASTEFTSAVEAAGIPLIRIPERRAFDPGALSGLRSAVNEVQPQVVQTHAVKSHFLMYVSGVWRTRPWIAFHHGYTTPDTKMLLYNQLDRISLRAPARLVTVSRAFERQLTERGVDPSRITVLHNAVDPQWAASVKAIERGEARRQLGIAPDEFVIVAAGRMSSEKGHIHLLAAFERLRQTIAKAHLILVGDGPERARLELAAGTGVVFTGQVADARPYFAVSDVLVLPSLTEGSPNVLLEAMAVDLPVVATKVGGIPEIVENEVSALLVEPRDPEALARAIERLWSEPGLRASLVCRARAAIERSHLPESRARILTDLYNSVLACGH